MHNVHVLYHTQVREVKGGRENEGMGEGKIGRERKGIKEGGQEEGVGKEREGQRWSENRGEHTESITHMQLV